MSAQHQCDWCMSLNSICMLVKVFSDIIMLQMCLNDIIMFWEQNGARPCGVCLKHTHIVTVCIVALISLTNMTCATWNKHVTLKEQPENIWLLSLMWWSWIMQSVSTWLVKNIQSNTQEGVWPCKLPIDSLPLQLLAKSPELMSDLSKQPRRNWPSTVAG